MPPRKVRGGKIVNSIRYNPASTEVDEEESSLANAKRFAEINLRAELDTQMGFPAFVSGPARLGWMCNMQSTYVIDAEWPSGRSAMEYYFMMEDGSCFRSYLTYSPYFFVKCKPGTENQVEEYLRRRFENIIESMQRIFKEDLDLPNHLAGVKRYYLRLSFRNTNDLMTVRKVLLPIATRNGENYKDGVFSSNEHSSNNDHEGKRSEHGALSNIVGLREYDIPYHLRVSIDLDIRVGHWYTVSVHGPKTTITRVTTKDVRPDPVILAFDIETSKMPLKFPDASQDHIMMISYMINGRGFLIVNRDIVSQDIDNFEYTPKPDFPGIFTVFNVPDEQSLLNKFFTHIQLVRPQIFTTYNGDFFDWPFIEARAAIHNMDMAKIIGISKNSQGEYCGTYCAHLDCFCWVKRDSYLPAGSHGLKAVCSAKLGYDPLELDPELMTPLASSDPQTLANYSVSDAVATFYLYMKYVHPFIFSLCNIIPLTPDEVLRKGSGTLCETLLMAQAYKANVIIPNKHEEPKEKFFKGHLLESETYIGGHVEALEAGVYRSDFQYKFKINHDAINQLVQDLDRALKFFLEHESHTPLEQVKNYESVKEQIKSMLEDMKKSTVIHERPLIYHLDVGAMYPNIILTNRLQPSAMVDESACAVCDHNKPGKQCQRLMSWSWRGEFYSAKNNEYKMIKRQLEGERFPSRLQNGTTIAFHELNTAEQTSLIKKRLADYSQKVYKRTRTHEVIQRTAIVCQRENSFYIDTVRSFRDRRYDYKNLQKVWKKNLEEAQTAKDPARIEECVKLLVLYDSLQLAHKCILNSFYGYVMRKAARWYSMEMGGIVCETGAAIITLARQLIEQFGRPLELDTDGIWCMLPCGFPENFSFELMNGKKVSFAYPCVMLNHLLFDKFTNHQYQNFHPESKTFSITSENSIFFEIDGPYKAMVLPSSTEEGRQLKKRYAIFNHDGSLAELKGFEIKRRGELKLVKIFQSQIFKTYLGGSNLTECYNEVAKVANYWLDILYSKGNTLEDSELIDLISENRSMSKALEEYGEQKSTSISTAKRLCEFLGDKMVKEKGLNCKYIISSRPQGLPVTNRAIPVAIFSAAPEIRRHYLAKWLKDPVLSTGDIRGIIDWDYYVERLGSMIQKLIVIPAAMQQVSNPVPRVIPPEWLKKGAHHKSAKMEQAKITDLLKNMKSRKTNDIEDLGRKDLKPIPLSFKRPIDEENDVNMLPNVDINVDYQEWVSTRKKYWLSLSAKLKTKTPSHDTKKAHTLGSFFGNDRQSILKNPWQVISIEPTHTPGEFKLWVLVGSNLRQFNLVCPRKLYIATNRPLSSDIAGQLVHYRLPDGKSASHLYELVMPEKVFKENFISNSAALMDPILEGVYEAEIPLEFQTLIQLGSVVTVAKHAMSKDISGSEPVFTIDELNFKSTSEIDYLVEGLDYAYFGLLGSDSRQVSFLVLGCENPIVHIFVVDEGMRRQINSLKNLISQLIKSTDPQVPVIFNITEDILFEVDYFSEIESSYRAMQRSLAQYFDSRPLPTLMFTSCDIDPATVMPVFGRLPRIPIHPWLGTFTFPPLDWQRSAARRLLEYFVQINSWYRDRLTLSRFAHCPVANLPVDASLFVSDLFLARVYRNQGYLIPWSAKSIFGGSINKSLVMLIGYEPEIHDNPGMYRHAAVDMDVSGMAINAVLESSHINPDNEATDSSIFILKTLLTNWIKESVSTSNPHAASLVDNFYRWIRSGSSKLLPTHIISKIHISMNRAQRKLCEYLYHLGCKIAHSDWNRLLIVTSKDDPDNAIAFINYIMTDLKRTDGLAWITLRPSLYWKTLLWKDHSNYAGIPANETSVSLRLNLADYLPPVLVRPFTVLIAEYLAQAQKLAFPEMPDQKNDIIHEHSLFIEDEEEDISFDTSAWMTPEYRHKFLSIVREVQKLMSGAPRSSEDTLRKTFPNRIGSYLTLQNPPLIFINFLGAILSLDKRALPAINPLLRHSYALIGIKEFSDETTFQDPCRSFVLSSIICSNCNYCRNLDFCRDLDILQSMSRSGSSSIEKSLSCPSCGALYPLNMIEQEIIAKCLETLQTYQSQDMICKRCKGVAIGNLSIRCGCSGEWGLLEDQRGLFQTNAVVRKIAKAMNFNTLEAFVTRYFD